MVLMPAVPHSVVTSIGALSIIFGVWYYLRLLALESFAWRPKVGFIAIAVGVGLFLARAIDVVVFHGKNLSFDEIASFWNIAEGRYTVLGACITGIVLWPGLVWWGRQRWDKGVSATLVAALYVSLAASHVIGRVACLLNGCCYGRPTGTSFGILYPLLTTPGLRFGPVPLHPVQLYEATINLAFFLLLSFMWRRNPDARWKIPWLYLGGYAVGRLATDFYRGETWPTVDNALSPRVAVIMLGLIGVSGLAFGVFWKRRERHDAGGRQK